MTAHGQLRQQVDPFQSSRTERALKLRFVDQGLHHSTQQRLPHNLCCLCFCTRAQQLFVSYECGPEKRVFGVNYAQLVDTLSVFESASHAPLNIHYPGPDGELQLE